MKDFFKKIWVKIVYLFKKFVFNKEVFENSMEVLRDEINGWLAPLVSSALDDVQERDIIDKVFEKVLDKVKFVPPIYNMIETHRENITYQLEHMKTYASAGVSKKITMVFEKITKQIVASLWTEEA